MVIDAVKLEMSASKSYYLTDNDLELLSTNDSNSLTDVGLIFTIRNSAPKAFYIDELLPLFNHLQIEMIELDGSISAWDWTEWADDVSCISSSLPFIYDFNKSSNHVGSEKADIFEIKSVRKQYQIPEGGLGYYNELEAKKQKNESICYLKPGETYSWFFCLNYFLNKGKKYRVRLNHPSKRVPEIYDKLMGSIEEMPDKIEGYNRYDGQVQSEWIEFGPYD